MMNTMNNVNLVGRLACSPAIFTNKDGSCKIKLKIACQNAYKNKDGTRGAQFIPVERFISAERMQSRGLGVYALLRQGDQVQVCASLINDTWKDESGAAHYDLIVRIETLNILESKASRQARQTASA